MVRVPVWAFAYVYERVFARRISNGTQRLLELIVDATVCAVRHKISTHRHAVAPYVALHVCMALISGMSSPRISRLKYPLLVVWPSIREQMTFGHDIINTHNACAICPFLWDWPVIHQVVFGVLLGIVAFM